jgi:hypothetical protein
VFGEGRVNGRYGEFRENIDLKMRREDLVRNGRRILKWILNKYGGNVSSGLR